ncbi:hypothetical protein BGZ65_007588 [Modicella reniformis]|uniref:Large-conductance mechanosensitive channel n=1 Tax=Modicella reniformis TaxID=1440133 RepID=A0A9P6J6U7_9FUNG|nr:hypothetical protein BGZ65_007588 [Modicella reniformis]
MSNSNRDYAGDDDPSKAQRRSRTVVKGDISAVENGISNASNDAVKKVPGVPFFSDYRKFMDRGNVIDLAVAVIIGAAFTAIITSLVNDIITPVIAMGSGKSLEENFIVLNGNQNNTGAVSQLPVTRLQAKNAGMLTWNWGNFVQTVINFFIISVCIFIIIKVYQMTRNMKDEEVTEKKCDYCSKSIPLSSIRCPKCTTWLDWKRYGEIKCQERQAEEETAAAAGESLFVNIPIN